MCRGHDHSQRRDEVSVGVSVDASGSGIEAWGGGGAQLNRIAQHFAQIMGSMAL